MKKNAPNSQDTTSNNSNTNNYRNKNGTSTTFKECSKGCKQASSCTSANQRVKEIERYTREAENLVEALSALTKLAEQLKPCIDTKSQCSQSGTYAADVNSDSSSNEDDKDVNSRLREEDEDSDQRIPVVKKRQQDESRVVNTVRSAPDRVKSIEENKDYCLCCCSSTQQGKVGFKDDKTKVKKDKQSDDKTGCCGKKKTKEKKIDEVITELKPLPMPPMTIVHPVERPKPIKLHPALTYNDPITDKAITSYPTVAATTTKAAMNLDDKQMQACTESICLEAGCNTEPVQFADGGGGKTKDFATGCPEDYGTKVGVRDVGTEREAITLNAIPFEEYAENDFAQYWYDVDDAPAVLCKCSSTTDIDSKPIPSIAPPSTPTGYQSRSPVSPPFQSEPQQQSDYPQSQYPINMIDCYPYYHGGQQYQQQMDYNAYNRPMEPTGAKQIYNDTVATGINAVNYAPPGGLSYRACRVKGSTTDSQKMQGFEEIDCVPSCQSTNTQYSRQVGAHGPASGTAPNVNQSEYSRPLGNGKKVVQYEDQQYDYYISQPQSTYTYAQQLRYDKKSYAPCNKNIPQRTGAQENSPANRQVPVSGYPTGPHQKQLNNMMNQHYNTLFVGKVDKDTEERMKKSDKNCLDSNASQCSPPCAYQNKTTNKKK